MDAIFALKKKPIKYKIALVQENKKPEKIKSK